jgi:hypothetical protein
VRLLESNLAWVPYDKYQLLKSLGMRYNQIQLGRNMIELEWFKNQQMITIKSITEKLDSYDGTELMMIPGNKVTEGASNPISLCESFITVVNHVKSYKEKFENLHKKISAEEELQSMDYHPELVKILECHGISITPDISETFGITNPTYSTRMTEYQIESEILLIIALEELKSLRTLRATLNRHN